MSRKLAQKIIGKLTRRPWAHSERFLEAGNGPFSYEIDDLHSNHPAIRGHEGEDEDFSRIVRGNLVHLSRKSKGAYAAATLATLNWPGASLHGDHFIFSGDQDGTRDLTLTMLEDWGCDVQPVSRNGDQHYRVTAPDGKSWVIALRLMLLRKMIETAQFERLRTDRRGALTTDAYNYALQSGRIAVPQTNSKGRQRRYVGNLFRVVDVERGAPLVYDPEQVLEEVVAAIEAWRCPPYATNITLACGSSGRRYSDMIGSSLLDWAAGSGFQTGIYTDLKGRQGGNREIAYIDDRCRTALAAEIDARHAKGEAVPSMAQARRMWNGGRPTAADRRTLALVSLFATRSGRPPSYSYFRRRWFKPAMDARGVLIWGPSGSRPATFHWLRRAYVHRRLKSIYARPLTRHQIKEERDALQEYMGWKTDQIGRYAAHYEKERKAREEARYQDARDEADIRTVDQLSPASPEEAAAAAYFLEQPE